MALRLKSEKQLQDLKKGLFNPKNDATNNGKAEGKSKSKYRNEKTSYDGKKFDSLKERDRYIELCLLVRAGLIRDLKCQVPFVLLNKVKFISENKMKKEAIYIADFTYLDVITNKLVVEDVKSKKTSQLAVYRLKKHHMKEKYNIDIVEIIY